MARELWDVVKVEVWMIKAVHEEPYPNQTECDVNSYTTTLTFEVK